MEDGTVWDFLQAGKGPVPDLRRIYDLRNDDRIDGLYTLNALRDFRSDLEAAARRLGLL